MNVSRGIDYILPPMRSRDVRIDLLRAIAIIEIIFEHALMLPCFDERTFHYLVLFIPDSAAMYIMVSGALILPLSKHKGRGQWAYVRHRLSMYMPEFVLFSALYVGLDVAMGFDAEMDPPGMRLAWMLVTPTWGPGWFILALSGLYLLAPVVSGWLEGASRRDVEVVLCIWLVATLVPAISCWTPVDVPRSIFGVAFNYMGYMVLGYYLTRWPFAERSVRFRAGVFGAAVFFGIVCAAFIAPRAWRWGILPAFTHSLSLNVVALAVLQVLVLLLVPARCIPRWLGRVAVVVSVCSLGIYCSHWVVIRYVAIPNGWGYAATVAATIAFAVCAAVVMRVVRVAIGRCCGN